MIWLFYRSICVPDDLSFFSLYIPFVHMSRIYWNSRHDAKNAPNSYCEPEKDTHIYKCVRVRVWNISRLTVNRLVYGMVIIPSKSILYLWTKPYADLSTPPFGPTCWMFSPLFCVYSPILFFFYFFWIMFKYLKTTISHQNVSTQSIQWRAADNRHKHSAWRSNAQQQQQQDRSIEGEKTGK